MFSKDEIIEDFSALNYLIDFYFPKYKVAIEVDKLGHKDRDQTKENKRQKDLKEYLDCKFIRINIDEKNCDINDGFKKLYHSSMGSTRKKQKNCWLMIFQKKC